ncbi:MAG: glycine cleavage system aminomethyltransferase GcvT, partial [Acidimicrobiales bacterium]|nr:glycine cleavage system aminomethyltransferase GcvT [Acidimicrobiales bacterium]
VDFGGWEMPIAYPSGTLAEHLACRSSCALFDVSHLGTVTVSGADAFDRLQGVLSNDLAKIGPGRAQYTHLLDDADASVLDDIIVWWHPEVEGREPRFDVMPNASNTERVLAAVGGEDVTTSRAVIAVQGPAWTDVVATGEPALADIKRFRVGEGDVGGVRCTVAGTGYTGEDGVECAVPADEAPAFWQAVLDAGVEPAGLGARDTLRLEAALPLHGHELGPGITSLQARLGWVVAWHKGDFRGRAALEAERETGPARLLYGVATAGRRPPRAEQAVLLDGAEAGVITSGNFSPELGHGIALAFLPPGLDPGTELGIDVRGSIEPARIVATPFIPKR